MSRRAPSDPYLRQIFLDYNQRWFDGKLPEETRVAWASKETLRNVLDGIKRIPWGVYYRDEKNEYLPTILLDQELRQRKWWKTTRFTLLHEMCHLEGWGRDYHGPAFDRRMLRLALRGAFAKLW